MEMKGCFYCADGFLKQVAALCLNFMIQYDLDILFE